MLKNILYLSIFTTVVVVVWITASIYHNNVNSTVSRETTKQISPISPNFDQGTINQLLRRKIVPVNLSSPGSFSPPANDQTSTQSASFP